MRRRDRGRRRFHVAGCGVIAGLERTARWGLFFSDADRLREVENGIFVDSHCQPTANQDRELALRDSVAEHYFRSPSAAVAEATRHHSKPVMLRRARQQIAAARQRGGGADSLIVDLGCGFGWHWIDIASGDPAMQFILVDFSIINLRVCRALMPFERYPNVICLQASILDLPLRDAVADLAWSVQVMQHLAEVERRVAFRELRRVLKDGGAFYIAWLREVAPVRALFALLGKEYHLRGQTPYGLYHDRFNEEIHADLQKVFPFGRTSRSESLFHPELRIRPHAEWIGGIDLAVSSSILGRLLARQAEFFGTVNLRGGR
jgi:SAM-dependent methyltransferase